MSSDSERFKDHFSGHASDYALYRPSYPDALYQWLRNVTDTGSTAWDCATGNGQAANGLARYFDRVIATDASSNQIEQAVSHPVIEYRVEPAEHTSLADQSTDLVTVGQAYHWFDHPAFHEEVDRVLRLGGVLAIWTYKLALIRPEVDSVVYRLYSDIVGDYWPPERVYIDRDYRDFNLPWPEIDVPALSMEVSWDLHALNGYLRTWSALRRYVAANRADPLDLIADELLEAWGDPDSRKRVVWPLVLKACKKPC